MINTNKVINSDDTPCEECGHPHDSVTEDIPSPSPDITLTKLSSPCTDPDCECIGMRIKSPFKAGYWKTLPALKEFKT